MELSKNQEARAFKQQVETNTEFQPVENEISPESVQHVEEETLSTLSFDDPNTNWYALYTRSRFEKIVYHHLKSNTEFKVFLPQVKIKRKWSDRLQSVIVPLLPGYVFVKMNPLDIPKVKYCRGLVRVVSFDGKPCEVSAEEIRLLEEIVTHGFPVSHHMTNCEPGDEVRIIRGPLKGWEGKVERGKGQSRIVFQITSIQQAFCVEVSLADVEKI